METQCSAKQLHLQGLGARKVVGSFDGGTITSDAGALLLREVDQANGLFDAFASCFLDGRDPRFVEHSVRELDPTGADRRHERDRGIPLAGKSTLNRMETFGTGTPENQKYKKIYYSPEKIDQFFVDVFTKTHRKEPAEIVLDLDATDDPLHGHQQGRFFHGYYNCYCYLPLYVFCGDQLLYAKLKRANLDPGNECLEDVRKLIEGIRAHWPEVRIVLRGDSGFCRDELMSWCEEHGVSYVFGLAKNNRLVKRIAKELKKARKRYYARHQPQRIYKDFYLPDPGQLVPSPESCRKGGVPERRGKPAFCGDRSRA
jgi:hypothetical protein